MRGTVLCESDARMALAEPVSVAYCNSALQGSCEVAREDVLLNSSPRTAEPHNGEPGEDSKMENYQVNSLGPKAFSSPGSSVWTTRCDGEVRLRMEEQGPGSEAPKTVHQLLQESVNKYSDYYALASKKDGQWVKLTYKMYYDECWKAAKSFLKLGLERFHGVGILGFNSAEWFIADIGAILAGGLAVGIYTTNSPEACHYVAENCSANIIVVENHKQLQKILEIEHRLPHLKGIVQYREEIKEKRPNLYSWREFMELGRDVPDSQLREIIASQKPNQCCTLIYTSGTTGQPKGVMLSHDNLTWTAAAAARFIMLSDAHDRQEEVVSYLPLSHIAAQMCDIWAAMTLGVQVYFAQPDALKGSLVETLKEVRPTAFLGVPRVWEKMEEKMKSVGMKASALRRKVATWAKGVGLQTNLKRMNGCSEVPVNFRLAQQLVYRKVRKAIGLDRCTKCYTGAAPIARETLEFFLSLNIPVLELYGMSESSGPHTASLPHAFKLGSCGKELIGCRTLIHKPDKDGIGEICFSGRHIFMGYLNMEDKTKEAIDEDGWLHSGDQGKHDKDGFLFITGRIKELIITAGGENIPPVPIEDAVKNAVPIISNAMLVGDRAKFLSMLLTLKCVVDEETGEPRDDLAPEALEFCQKLGSKATKVSEIISSKDKAIYAAIQKGISAVNEGAVSNAQKVQKWVLLEKDFSLFGGELGPTLKLKRPVVAQKYQDQIAQFYTDIETPSGEPSRTQSLH
ncbi:Long-chain-fatty-acid--CoA ligase ACSBG2 [Lonchura striata]|uniref:Long-chain-fatty-acid--CoA ligase ACSBG2 n=1 Tax=Lonchura striata TaxID=40157 RepID=A0A218UCJ7_9PASE|nr:long-chain-fatty-acid--CoA ligase ACSBG2 isoform X2 [Lonchura striata domestica]OWK51429.1 Long-chain-fatty-acid--CoA ligase ACSBG2 [Lonchura striata domestica]